MRRPAVAFALTAVLVLGTDGVPPATAGSSEAELKAELIERFTRFVDWDEDDLPENDFQVCVLGESPVTAPLKKIARKRKLKSRSTSIVQIDKLDELADCQVVLISSTDKKKIASAISRTEGHPILTITDAPGGAALGAIINFYRADKNIKYEVNTRAGEDSGLTLRAKLLRLARIVRTKRGD